jgi:hypothetical protein
VSQIFLNWQSAHRRLRIAKLAVGADLTIGRPSGLIDGRRRVINSFRFVAFSMSPA